jgi:hypothetical protein
MWAHQRLWLRHYTVVSPFFVKCPNLVFKRQCYNRAVVGVSPMGTFEAYVLIVSSTIALFWLSVRSEANRSGCRRTSPKPPLRNP